MPTRSSPAASSTGQTRAVSARSAEVTIEESRQRRCRSLTLLGSHEWEIDADIGRALAELPLLRCRVLSSMDPLDAGTGTALQKRVLWRR